MNWRPAVTRAREALEDGDVDFAYRLLAQVLEDRRVVDREGRRRTCPACGVGPMWPGQLDDHVLRLHERRAA